MKIEAGIACAIYFTKDKDEETHPVLIKGVYDDKVWVMYFASYKEEILSLSDIRFKQLRTYSIGKKPFYDKPFYMRLTNHWIYWDGMFWKSLFTRSPVIFDTEEYLNNE